MEAGLSRDQRLCTCSAGARGGLGEEGVDIPEAGEPRESLAGVVRGEGFWAHVPLTGNDDAGERGGRETGGQTPRR